MDTESSPRRYEVIETRFEPSRVSQAERRLGRYELIYEIGSGGMASVYLARARGPANFEKWFAIKRIHDNLVKDESFVHMFLDEARIAAALQHPNVAQTFDLGEAGGKYFIAMEYLHGEPLTAVTVRSLARRDAPLPFALAAHLVARAADGLHHAHEANDSRGRKLSLVHRDVSPHNIFVTYDGVVKLTDFGVAKAAGRLTATDTGTMKGKLSYASPEQIRGEALDRRTDLFALGIVLFEISVGQRLFRGDTDAETLHRIIAGRRPRPSTVMDGFPPTLEAIIERALALDVSQRYQTADELARDLDRFVANEGERIGTAELGELMRSLFEAEIHEKDRILHGEAPPPSVERPGHDVNEPSSSALRRRSETSLPAASPSRSRRGMWIALGILALAGIASGLAVFLSGPGDATVRIDSEPSGARVWIDGASQDGETPLLVEHVDTGTHRIMIELEGRARVEASFEVDGEREDLSYVLVPSGARDDIATAQDIVPSTDGPAIATAETPALETVPDETVPDETVPDETVPEATSEEANPPEIRHERGARDRESPPAATASLSLVTVPWAKVYVGSRYLGDTPLHRQTIPAGRQRLRLQPEGEGPMQNLSIETRAGEHLEHPRVDLRAN